MFVSGDKIVCVDADGLTCGIVKEGKIYTFYKYLSGYRDKNTNEPVDVIKIVEAPADTMLHSYIYRATRFRKLTKDLDNKEVTEDFRKLLKDKVS